MPWQVVSLMLDDLTAERWSRTDENLATLVDVQSWWLEAEYVKWTTDPAEAKAAARRSSSPTPPLPALRAVAYRPPEAHAAAVARYAARNVTPPTPGVPEGQLSARALAKLIGL